MSWVCEIVLAEASRQGGRPAAAADPAAVRSWFEGGPRRVLEGLNGVSTIDVYQGTADGYDPFNQDGPGPLLLAVVGFSTPDALRAATADPRFAASLRAAPLDVEAHVTTFERRFYPIEGETTEATAWDAPVSYVVRYHRPAQDEAAFIENYVATHPPTLARLPGIRAVMCYFPRPDLNGSDLPRIDYIIGNEVSFDSVEHFNAAMESPVRLELRAHFHDFPPFSGANTHYLMRRHRLSA